MKTNYILSTLISGMMLFITSLTYSQCDTLRNYNPNDTLFQFTTINGSILGLDEIDDGIDYYYTDIWVEPYYSATPRQVTGVRFAPWEVQNNSGTDSLFIVVFDDFFGSPGNLLGFDAISYNDINTGVWNTLIFDNPVTVSGTFYVGYLIPISSPLGAFAMYGTKSNVNYSMAHLFGPNFGLFDDTWFEASDLYIDANGNDLNLAFVMDVLTTSSIPVADFTVNNSTICLSGEFIVNATNSSNGLVYDWFLTDDPITQIYNNITGNSIDTISPVTANPSNQQLILWLDGACHSYDLMAIPVTVLPDVTATVNITPENCNDGDGIIDISGVSGGSGSNYTYSIDGGITTSQSGIFNNLTHGQYNVVVSSSGGGCTFAQTVNVGGGANNSIIPDPDFSTCEGTSVNLNASGTGTIEWFDSGISLGTGNSINVTPIASTTYDVVLTDVNGCTDTGQLTVTVNPNPTITVSPDTTVCAGTALIISASGAATYNWDNGLGAGDSQSIAPVTTTTYQVIGTDANTCTDTAQIVVTVNSLDDAGFNYNENVYCNSGALNPVPTINTPGGIFQASSPDLIFDDNTTGEINITASQIGNYDIYYTTNGNCPNADTVTISIIATPDASFNYPANDFCQSDGVIVPNFQGGATPGVFSGSAGASLNVNTGEVDLTTTTPGTHTITNLIAATSTCPSANFDVDIVVKETPVITVNDDMTVCENSEVTLTATASVGTITWDNGITNGAAFTPTSTGTFTYNVTVDNDGCISTDQVNVTVEVCLGISQNEFNTVEIYPNPASNIVTIKINENNKIKSVVLMSLEGKVISTNQTIIDNNSANVDMSSIANGAYLISINTADGMLITKKIMKR